MAVENVKQKKTALAVAQGKSDSSIPRPSFVHALEAANEALKKAKEKANEKAKTLDELTELKKINILEAEQGKIIVPLKSDATAAMAKVDAYFGDSITNATKAKTDAAKEAKKAAVAAAVAAANARVVANSALNVLKKKIKATSVVESAGNVVAAAVEVAKAAAVAAAELPEKATEAIDPVEAAEVVASVTAAAAEEVVVAVESVEKAAAEEAAEAVEPAETEAAMNAAEEAMKDAEKTMNDANEKGKEKAEALDELTDLKTILTIAAKQGKTLSPLQGNRAGGGKKEDDDDRLYKLAKEEATKERDNCYLFCNAQDGGAPAAAAPAAAAPAAADDAAAPAAADDAAAPADDAAAPELFQPSSGVDEIYRLSEKAKETTFGKVFLDSISKSRENIFEDVKKQSDIWSGMKTLGKGIVSETSKTANAVKQSLSDTISDMYLVMRTKISDLPNFIKYTFFSTTDFFKNGFKSIWKNVVLILSGIVESIFNLLTVGLIGYLHIPVAQTCVIYFSSLEQDISNIINLKYMSMIKETEANEPNQSIISFFKEWQKCCLDKINFFDFSNITVNIETVIETVRQNPQPQAPPQQKAQPQEAPPQEEPQQEAPTQEEPPQKEDQSPPPQPKEQNKHLKKLACRKYDTIEMVKANLRITFNIPSKYKILLTFGDTEIDTENDTEQKTLADYNVKDDSTIQMKLTSAITVNIITPDHLTKIVCTKLLCNSDDTIALFMDRLRKRLEIKSFKPNILITFENTEIDTTVNVNKTLDKYNITDGSIIKLSLKPIPLPAGWGWHEDKDEFGRKIYIDVFTGSTQRERPNTPAFNIEFFPKDKDQPITNDSEINRTQLPLNQLMSNGGNFRRMYDDQVLTQLYQTYKNKRLSKNDKLYVKDIFSMVLQNVKPSDYTQSHKNILLLMFKD